jgi:hypothetical protein
MVRLSSERKAYAERLGLFTGRLTGLDLLVHGNRSTGEKGSGVVKHKFR